jgi:4-hydroxy-3-methylbut-2-enyl diphosphate reductase
MGVRRAVALALAQSGSGATVYTMGPLIHTPRVLEDLRARGIRILDEQKLPQRLDGAVVIIRAHGVTPALEARLTGRGAVIVDATCPRVRSSQLKARALVTAGYRLFLAGEARHGEIVGIQGYAAEGGRGTDAAVALVASSAEEAAAAAERLFARMPAAKTALIAQTTITEAEFRAIAGAIQRFFPSLELVDTICNATRDRQNALRELCAQAEAVVIAGGRDSANTRRLLAIARGEGRPSWLVEGAGELPEELASFRTVGLSAGASTPDAVITEIEAALRR